MNQEIKNLESEIAEKELQLEQLKENHIQKLNRSKDFIQSLTQEFESSSQLTQQFQAFHRIFKRDFTNILKSFNAENIEFNRNHFGTIGFFTHNGQVYYFSLGDVRWNKDRMLIRTAKDYKDYTGGSNEFLNTENREKFLQGLKGILK